MTSGTDFLGFEHLHSALDLQASTLPSVRPRVFLCGGRVLDPAAHPGSARDGFLRWVHAHDRQLADAVVLAEVVDRDLDRVTTVFTDLLELEEYLARCGSLTVLFVESPGSFAELGSFAALKDIARSTIAVGDTQKLAERSFIARGPIRRLEKTDDKSVLRFRWPRIANGTTLMPDEDDMAAISKHLRRRLNSMMRRRIPSTGIQVHRLITALLYEFDILAESDLLAAIYGSQPNSTGAAARKLQRVEIRKHLLALEILGSIRRHPYSNEHYYVPSESLGPRRWVFRPNSQYPTSMEDWVEAFTRTHLQSDTKRRSAHRDWLKSEAIVQHEDSRL